MPRQNVWALVASWQNARPLTRQISIQGGKNRRTLIWEADGQNGVAVIEKVGDESRGHYVDATIVENKSFETVVRSVKRAYAKERKKAGDLC